MQVEQLLNNPMYTHTHTHTHTHTVFYLCLQKGQQLVGETSQEFLVQEGGDARARLWRSASHVVRCSCTDNFDKNAWFISEARAKRKIVHSCKWVSLLSSNIKETGAYYSHAILKFSQHFLFSSPALQDEIVVRVTGWAIQDPKPCGHQYLEEPTHLAEKIV